MPTRSSVATYTPSLLVVRVRWALVSRLRRVTVAPASGLPGRIRDGTADDAGRGLGLRLEECREGEKNEAEQETSGWNETADEAGHGADILSKWRKACGEPSVC